MSWTNFKNSSRSCLRQVFSPGQLRLDIYVLLMVAGAALLSYAFHPVLEGSPGLLFVVVVALSVILSGLRGGVIATLVSLVVLNVYLYPPLYDIDIQPANLVELGVFVLTVVGLNTLRQSRLRFEDALRQNETLAQRRLQELQDIYASSPVGLCFFDTDLRYISINEQLAAWNNSTVEEMVGMRLRERSRLLADIIEPLLRQVIETGQPIPNHIFFAASPSDPTDERAWMVTYYPRKDADGVVIGVNVVVQDITEQVQAERELSRREAQFRAMAETVPDILFSARADGTTDYISPRFFTYTGLHAETDEPEHLWPKAVHPDDLEATRRKIEDAVRRKVPYFNEYRLRGADGRYRWFIVRSKPVLDGEGEITQWFGAVTDIHDLKQVQQQTAELQQVAAQLSQAVTMQDVLSVVLRSVRETLLANAAAVVILNANERAVQLMHVDGIEDSDDASWQALNSGHDSMIGRVTTHQQELWFGDMASRVTDHPATTDVGAPQGAWAVLPIQFDFGVQGALLICFHDAHPYNANEKAFVRTLVSYCEQALDRASLYESEAAARQEAEKADAIKTRFLSVVSHELRTPLTSIKGFASTLLAEDVEWDAEDQLSFLGEINTEADRLDDLIEQLLMVSRAEANTLTVTPDLYLMNEVIDRAMNRLDVLTDQHQLEIEIADDLPPLMIDCDRLAQVLVNLVDNAAKFSPPDTTITVKAVHADDAVRVEVQDQGSGIPPEEREMVFEAFHQLSDNSGRGVGLGLAICQGIVEAHGGTIWVEDSGHDGTTIAFRVPLVSRESAVSGSTD